MWEHYNISIGLEEEKFGDKTKWVEIASYGQCLAGIKEGDFWFYQRKMGRVKIIFISERMQAGGWWIMMRTVFELAGQTFKSRERRRRVSEALLMASGMRKEKRERIEKEQKKREN